MSGLGQFILYCWSFLGTQQTSETHLNPPNYSFKTVAMSCHFDLRNESFPCSSFLRLMQACLPGSTPACSAWHVHTHSNTHSSIPVFLKVNLISSISLSPLIYPHTTNPAHFYFFLSFHHLMSICSCKHPTSQLLKTSFNPWKTASDLKFLGLCYLYSPLTSYPSRST